MGLGARFTFTLPAHGETASGQAGPVCALRRVPLEKNRRVEIPEARVPVLAVDDDPQALRFVSDTLVNAGYAPLVTGDPQDALLLMEQEQPQLGRYWTSCCPEATASS